MRNAWQILGFQRVLLPGEPRVSAPRRPPRAHANLKAALGDREWELDADATPPVAAHVVTSRVGYTHHGIHMGNGRVVHYSGLSRGWRGGPVEEVSLAEFARGRRVRVRVHVDARFDRDAVIARALSRLGENRYRALSNNCEHLCEWCIYGENRSRQIEVLRSWSLRALRTMWHLVGAPVRPLSQVLRADWSGITRPAAVGPLPWPRAPRAPHAVGEARAHARARARAEHNCVVSAVI